MSYDKSIQTEQNLVMSEIHDKLVLVPDPRLRQPCDEVKIPSEDMTDLVTLMKEVMTACRNAGIGTGSISAPQVGFQVRVFIIWTYQIDLVAINPVITKANGKQTMIEGCLSFPKGVHYLCERPSIVKFHYTDLAGKYCANKFHDLYAAMVMHENDHLNGVLIDDNGVPYGR